MTPFTQEWMRLRADIVRTTRRLRWARRIVRALFGPEFVVQTADNAEVTFGYVVLWNDIRPVVDAALACRKASRVDGPLPFGALQEPVWNLSLALDRYEALYPGHFESVTESVTAPVEESSDAV
jgi:hypothetical protein